MLSLGRKSGQYIVIDDNIIVKVEDTKNGLKLFIDVPADVKIVRSEVWEKDHPVHAGLWDGALWS
ncbi:carbon storage regulator [Clostridiales bacterium]|nr:carbon storage regulator [Clostridiales bacterium]